MTERIAAKVYDLWTARTSKYDPGRVARTIATNYNGYEVIGSPFILFADMSAIIIAGDRVYLATDRMLFLEAERLWIETDAAWHEALKAAWGRRAGYMASCVEGRGQPGTILRETWERRVVAAWLLRHVAWVPGEAEGLPEELTA